jgi:hypothetical protein
MEGYPTQSKLNRCNDRNTRSHQPNTRTNRRRFPIVASAGEDVNRCGWEIGLLGKDRVDGGLSGVLGIASSVWVAEVFAAVFFELFRGL